MTGSQLINTTSVAGAFALPSVSAAALNWGRSTYGNAVDISGATGSKALLAVVTATNSEFAANRPLGLAPSYQHDLSNRSRVSLKLSSVDPDIAGLDTSIEGGELHRHDW